MVNGETFLVATACEALAIILALGRGHIEAAIQHDIVPVLVELLVVGNLDLFIPALKAIHAATSNGTRDQIRVLTGTGCIERLCDYLDSYPDDDDPIVEILEVLANMLRAGADRRGANPMAAEVLEHGGFDLLQELRRHDNPEIRAGAVALLQTYFDEEQDESEAESDSDASGEADEDEDEDDGEDGSGR